jgi:hypothetical protein
VGQTAPKRVRNNLDLQSICLAFVNDSYQGHVTFRKRNQIAVDAFHLEPAEWSRDNKAEISYLRLSGCGPVNLVDDAVTQGDPHPRDAERGRDHVLGAGSPGRPNTGSARSVFHACHLILMGREGFKWQRTTYTSLSAISARHHGTAFKAATVLRRADSRRSR